MKIRYYFNENENYLIAGVSVDALAREIVDGIGANAAVETGQ